MVLGKVLRQALVLGMAAVLGKVLKQALDFADVPPVLCLSFGVL